MKPKGKDMSVEYRVEAILDHRVLPDNTLLYLVKWESFPVSECTFEPEQSFCDDNEILLQYKRRRELYATPNCGISFQRSDFVALGNVDATTSLEGREARVRQTLIAASRTGAQTKVDANNKKFKIMDEPAAAVARGMRRVLLRDGWPLAAVYADRSPWSQEAALREYLCRVSGLAKRRKKAEQSRRRAAQQAAAAASVTPTADEREKHNTRDKRRNRRYDNFFVDARGGDDVDAVILCEMIDGVSEVHKDSPTMEIEEQGRPKRNLKRVKREDEMDEEDLLKLEIVLNQMDGPVAVDSNEENVQGKGNSNHTSNTINTPISSTRIVTNDNNDGSNNNNSNSESEREHPRKVSAGNANGWSFGGRTAKQRVEALEDSICNGLLDGVQFLPKVRTAFQLFRVHRVAELQEQHSALSVEEANEMAEEEWDDDLCEEDKRWFQQRASNISSWVRKHGNRRPSEEEDDEDFRSGDGLSNGLLHGHEDGFLALAEAEVTTTVASDCAVCGTATTTTVKSRGKAADNHYAFVCEGCTTMRPASPTVHDEVEDNVEQEDVLQF